MTALNQESSPPSPGGNEGLIALARQAKHLPHLALAIAISVIVIFGGALIGGPIAAAILQGLLFPGGAASVSDSAVLSGLSEAVYLICAFLPIYLVLWLWLEGVERRPFRTLGLEPHARLRKIGRGLLAALLMFGGVTLVLWATGNAVAEAGPAQLQGLPALGGVAVIALGWIVQASGEELLFRGWLLQVIGARYRVWLGVLISSLLFSAAHLLNPGVTAVAVVNLLLVGVFLALYALRDGSVWGVCAWHAMWNWMQGNLLGFEVSGLRTPGGTLFNLMESGPDVLTGGAFGPEGGLAVTAVLLAGIGVLGLSRRRSTP